MGNQNLIPRPAVASPETPSSRGRGVVVTAREGMGLATVLARKGNIPALLQRVHDSCDIVLPCDSPRAVSTREITFVCTGPAAWLALSSREGADFPSSLRTTLGDLASVSDQSSGYVILHLTGPKIREALAKLIPLDLHESAFAPGQAGSTVAHYVPITLWRLGDSPAGYAAFALVIPRSFAASFWHALMESGAEFGICMD